MPAERDPYVLHCLELLAPLGPVRSRRMFGGHGLYIGERFVALIALGRLYLKADDQTRPSFERAGCAPFIYERPSGERFAMGYWSVPDDAMESPGAMQPWARLALAASLRAAAAKPAAKPAPQRKRAGRPARQGSTTTG